MKIRLFVFPLIVLTWSSCFHSKNVANKGRRLDGFWQPIHEEISGKDIAGNYFQSQRMTIADTLYTVVAESTDKGLLEFHDNKIDIYGKEGINTGKHFKAIYKVENSNLYICYDLSGKDYPENYDTKKKSLYLLIIFKRADE